MIAPIPLWVECHAGHRGEEYPTALHLEGRRREVVEVLDRWYEGSQEPGSRAAQYFKVRTAEGPPLILKHDPEGCVWYLICGL